ncbi:hypothetical protein UY3_10158 [Chelonia mydas]|uniref:Uncharacterized protein n=1 Tax=Chelonia mydas TaxID=8469 RepID=M7BKZ3_CHEMY|nr:hypothetical protein UY3_10158 [Chelonia mydas]
MPLVQGKPLAGRAGYGSPRVLRPPLPAAPIGLEQQPAASGSCDRTNLRTRQDYVMTSQMSSHDLIAA